MSGRYAQCLGSLRFLLDRAPADALDNRIGVADDKQEPNLFKILRYLIGDQQKWRRFGYKYTRITMRRLSLEIPGLPVLAPVIIVTGPYEIH